MPEEAQTTAVAASDRPPTDLPLGADRSSLVLVVASRATSGHYALVAMTKEEFVSRLVDACPETRPIADEHREDFDNDILLHLLIADVLRFAIAAFEAGDEELLSRCLGAVAAGMSDGDDYVQNAIGVSFVEDTPLWDPAMEPFIATWPQPLQIEAARQRRS